ncbi:MAG: AAA family ATPase [Peptostreptococcaceae bacterium]|nr:AAA family ATPase [Peptostreptococcaceae bacterium]
MQILLKSLTLKNFKGVRDRMIEFNDTITNIFGRNATGKTTLFDAYSWLLWDKDSVNRSDFGIKTVSESGKALHGLDHSVEGVLEIDGKTLTLKKVYSEKWTKKRGQAEAEFSGHTTEYFVSGVPVKKKEYQDRIGSIIQEDLFKLLSNPAHFSVALDKNKRREILMTLVKDVSDAEIIAENPQLRELSELMQDYRIDELRAMRKAQASKINREIQELPIRISELAGIKKDLDFSSLSVQLTQKKAELERVDRALTNENAQAEEHFERLNEIHELEAQALQIRSSAEQEASRKRLAVANALLVKKSEVSRMAHEIEEKGRDIERAQSNIDRLDHDTEASQKQIHALRVQYVEEAAKQYSPPAEDRLCPTCGQAFPESEAEKIRNAWNRQKAQKLEKLTTLANELKATITRNAEVSAEQKRVIEIFEQDIATMERQKSTLAAEIETAENVEPLILVDMMSDPVYVELLQRIEAKKKSAGEPRPDVEVLKIEKAKVMDELKILENQLAWQEENRRIDEKIAEYAAQEKMLSQQYAECEKVLFLCEEFVKAKVAKISGSINSLFDTVEFKLFDTQVNGAIVETCEATIQGVPFSDANNAAKINAGIDIINTLSRLYGTSTPIFVDNAESVNRLQATAVQVIRLIVSEDEQLTVR